jgi:uncharacterized protein (TIGR03437 family)
MRIRFPALSSYLLVVFCLGMYSQASGQTGTITTVAGNGTQGFSGDGGPATSASLYDPVGVTLDASGNLFIADDYHNRIREVSASGIITTVAGNGTNSFSGDGGPATSASLNFAPGVTLDASGNLFIADFDNNRIRKVSANGIITTVAGNGSQGFSGDGGPATSASLYGPFGVALDASGNLFIADSENNRIRKVSTSGTITTVAGNGTYGVFSGDGGPATSASLNLPIAVTVDSSGNLFIVDAQNNRIRMVSASGIITTVAGNGTRGFSGDGGPATSASLFSPFGAAVDSSGNLFIADGNNNRIRKVSANGIITTVAGSGNQGFSGDGGPATSASLYLPNSVAVDSAGNIFIGDTGNNRIRKVSPSASGPPATSQTITFGQLSNVTLGIAPFPVSATASSGLAVSFASTTPTVCTVSGSTVTIIAAGTCSITASQAGNANYTSATPVTQSFTVTAASGPLQIPGGGGATPVTITSGTVSIPYSQLLPASNGNPPYSWFVLGGALPKGLSLSSSGTLSGTPAQAGTFEFTGKVTDTSGASASSMFLITIAPQTLTITTVSPLPNGIAGSDYPAQIFTATGGNAPYTFQITGALPGGFKFSGGEISGVPTTTGVFNFTVTATDSSVPALTASAPFQLTIQTAHPDLILSQASLAFSLNLGATGLPSGANVSVRSSVASQLLNYSVVMTPVVTWLDFTGGGSTPGAIAINLDPKALSLVAGVSQTSIVVTCIAPSPCAGNSQTIHVSLTVSAAQPQLAVTSSLLSFSAQTANPQPVSQTLGLQNVGGGAITVNSITAANSFVTVSGVPATVAAGPAIPVTVTVNPGSLAAGFYQSTILVNTSAGSVNVPVTLLLAQDPTMTLSPAGTQFQQAVGSSPGNSNGSFLVAVFGTSTVSWSATQLPGANWLTLNTLSGTSTSANPGTVSFSINPAIAAALTAQAFYGAIQVTSSDVVDSPLTFIVILNVAPAANPAVPDPTPAGLLFLSSASGAPAPQTVQVFTSSATPVTYQASSDSPWLLVSPASGSTSTASSGSSSVSVNLSGLAPGVYRGNVSYALSSAAVPTVNVTLIVEAGEGAADRTSKAITCVPMQLAPTQTGLVNNFTQPLTWPTELTVLLVDNCGNHITNGQVNVSFNNGDPPLTLMAADTTSGTYSATWTPNNVSSDLTIVATATASGFPMATAQLFGQVTPNPAAPVLNQNGTLNAFAIAAEPGAPLAPGTIVQIYGSNLAAQTTAASTVPLPTMLGQTVVSIGGIAAPLYFVSPGQINAQVPFELPAGAAPGKAYSALVIVNNAYSTPNPIQLTSDAPGIAQYAAGQAIAQNAIDYSLITETSPAKPGDYIILYVAGMGLTSPTVASGVASPSTNLPILLDAPTLTLNGAQVTVFSALTPTLVGLYQVNFQVPANAPNGDLPLVLTQTSGQTASTILPVHN